MSAIFTRIQNALTEIFKKVFTQEHIDYLLVGLCILCSGYALFTSSNTTPRTICTVITCLIILIRFAFSLKVSTFKSIKKDKRMLIPPPTVICLFVFGIAAVLTLFINKESPHFISYVYFGFLVIAACFLCRTISFDNFRKIFCNILFVISLIAIVLFGVEQIIKIPLGYSLFELNNSYSSNFFFIFSQNVYLDRLQSIFWEPGVYASYLLIALSFEMLFEKKINWFHFATFCVALILTFSTAGYLLFVFLLVPFLLRKVKKSLPKTIIEFSFFPLIIIAVILLVNFSGQLANLMPTIFDKIANQNASFTTRILSPKINLEMFVKKPFFGWGIHGANEEYLRIVTEQYESFVDAQTSTSASLLAKFGILGFIYSLMLFLGIVLNKNKGLNIFELACFFAVIFLIVNKEPHTNMLISWAIPFYFVYETFDKKIIEKRALSSSDDSNTVLSLIKAKNDSGVVARNALMSFGLKGFALLIGLFTVPVYSTFFSNDSAYGIWLTFLSIITWVMTFDLGFGNGMKNKLIASIAKKDNEEGKRIVSSTYAFSLVIGSIILSVGLIVINVLDLTKVFNFDTSIISPSIVKLSFCITFSTIAIEFVLKNICHIFQAHQKHFLSNLLPLIANTFLLLFAVVIKFRDPSKSLLMLSIAYCFITLFPYFVASIISFFGPLKSIAPSFKYASFSKGRSVMSLGLMFFLVQLALLFLNSMDQIIISSLFSSEYVVTYTKYSKFFTVIVSISNIFNGIIWTSICKSVSDKNNKQLMKGVKSLLIFDVLMSLLCVVVSIFMQPLLDVWLGANSFNVNYFIVVIILIFTIENIFLSSTGSLLNGFQCLLPQAISIGIAAILKIPLILLVKRMFPQTGWESLYIINCFLWIPMLIVNVFFLIKNIRKVHKEDNA